MQRCAAWILTRAVLYTSWFLMLSWVALGVLVCNYSPLQYRDKPSINSTTQCLHHQGCFSCRGRYGSVHVLSAQGCVTRSLCGSSKLINYRGMIINATYTCCCHDRCNQPPVPETPISKLLGVTLAPAQKDWSLTNTTSEPQDLCPVDSNA